MTWEYSIQLRNDVRRVTDPGAAPNQTRPGFGWELTRETPQTDEGTFRQSIVISPEVFESEVVAIARHAVKKTVNSAKCPIHTSLSTMPSSSVLDEE